MSDTPQFRQWRVGPSVFEAWPEVGARLMRWDIEVAGTRRAVIHWPDDADLQQPAKVRGGNPVLFPFPGRTFLKGDEGWWTDPAGKRRPMPRHGFAREGSFVVDTMRDDGFDATLQPTDSDREAYPFDYAFTVSYRFEELALRVEFRLANHGHEPIPWSAGHHFYFRLPWHEGASREDYRILLAAKRAFYHSGDGKLVRTTEHSLEENFGNPRLSDRIHTHLKQNEIRFGPKSGEEDIAVYHGDAPVPSRHAALVTWTERDDSPFYCVEPWMGPPCSPEHKNGLHWAGPGETDVFAVTVKLL